jgi:hypothetical protein
VLLVALPLIRLASGGPGWPVAISTGQPAIMAVDLAMVLCGGWMIWQGLAQRRRPVPTDNSLLEPAE